jgi:hypothetical protein
MMNNVGQMNPSGMINMHSNAMLDNFKQMMLTMTMIKGTNQTDNTSFFNTILIMFVVSFIDTIVIQVKKVVQTLTNQLDMYISKKTSTISIVENLNTALSVNKTKKSSIMVKLEQSNPTSNAVVDVITHLPHTKNILYKNGNFMVNYCEEIEITKGLYAQMSSGNVSSSSVIKIDESKNEQMSGSDSSSGHTDSIYGYVELFSYTYDMDVLRNELEKIVNDYLVKMTNKLGNSLYCFSVFPLQEYRDSNGKIDTSKSPEHLHFTMKPFKTNRSFKNLFGKNIELIKKRVEFFRDNEEWYNEKGIPYNLGIALSGESGSGKTSSIKALCQELGRHPFTVHFKDHMTTTQLENLFFDEQVHVLHNGKTHTFTIPINKRLYIFEDLDCQCEVILDRGSETAEQMLAKKNAELKEEIERLRHALNEMSSGKRVVMTGGGNMHRFDVKKNDDKKITMSFMLNLFDGITEQPGRVYVITSNFLDKLDKAFVRPGRFDVKCKFGLSDADQIIQIVEHRYDKKLTQEQIDKISSLSKCISPAELGNILFENFGNLEGALLSLEQYSINFLNKEKMKKEEDEKTNAKVLALEMEASLEIKEKEKEKVPAPELIKANFTQESWDNMMNSRRLNYFPNIANQNNMNQNTYTNIANLQKKPFNNHSLPPTFNQHSFTQDNNVFIPQNDNTFTDYTFTQDNNVFIPQNDNTFTDYNDLIYDANLLN